MLSRSKFFVNQLINTRPFTTVLNTDNINKIKLSIDKHMYNYDYTKHINKLDIHRQKKLIEHDITLAKHIKKLHTDIQTDLINKNIFNVKYINKLNNTTIKLLENKNTELELFIDAKLIEYNNINKINNNVNYNLLYNNHNNIKKQLNNTNNQCFNSFNNILLIKNEYNSEISNFDKNPFNIINMNPKFETLIHAKNKNKEIYDIIKKYKYNYKKNIIIKLVIGVFSIIFTVCIFMIFVVLCFIENAINTISNTIADILKEKYNF